MGWRYESIHFKYFHSLPAGRTDDPAKLDLGKAPISGLEVLANLKMGIFNVGLVLDSTGTLHLKKAST